jgi:beta-lactamase class A
MLRDEVEISLRDLAQLMMSVSDNAATDVLVARLGVERINATLRDLGLERTLLVGDCHRILSDLKEDLGLGEDEAFPPYARVSPERWSGCRSLRPETTTRGTPHEIALLLQTIWRDQAASAGACLEMRRVLSSQIWPHRLRSGFGDEYLVAGKTGTLPGIRNEAGVVEVPGGGRFAVAVFTRSARPRQVDPAADAVIGTAARLAVEHLRRS